MRRAELLAAVGFAAVALSACASGPSAQSQKSTSLAGSYLAANLAAAEGDMSAASQYYARTLASEPDNADLLQRSFVFATSAGDMDHARELAAKILVQDPDNRLARLVLSAGGLHDKNYAAAAGDNQQASGVPVTIITNALIAAWAQAGLGNGSAALAAIDTLKSQQGVDGLRQFQTATLFEFLHRDAEAETAYQEALKTMGTGPRLVEAYGRFLQRKGRNAEASALYDRAAMDSPDLPTLSAARARLNSTRMPAPLESTPAEGVAEGLFGIAASLNQARSADTAVLYLNLTIYLRPDFDLARMLLADRFEALERYDLANAQYARIASDSPYHDAVQVQTAINESRQGNTDKAVGILRAFLKSQPNDAQTWSALGDLLRDAMRYSDAADAYTHAITLQGGSGSMNWSLYYARGVSLSQANHWADAELDLKKALVLSPDQPAVLNYLGYSWVDQGRNLDNAMTMLEKARALRPLDGYIADSVGWAYYKLRRFGDAATTLEMAVQLSPGTSEINDHLGDAYWQIGRKVEARFQWNHALAMDPDPKAKPVLERKLQYGLEKAPGS